MSKVGRNELCPCGSGIKYKKCCLGKETSAVESILRLVTQDDPVVLGTAAIEAAAGAAVAADVPEPTLKLTLPKLKKLVTGELSWEQPSHQELALHLIDKMRESYDRELIFEALVLWNGFSRHNKPAVKKMGSFCAAIEYLLSEEYGLNVSQTELAAKYEVTAGTISRKVKELLGYVEEFGMGGDLQAPASAQGAGSPKEQAQALIYQAMDTHAAKRRVQLAEAALKLYPDSADAYLILAEECEDEAEVRGLLKAGIAAGKRELGELFFTQHKGHFWELNETRPYIRVCKSYAEACWLGGDAAEAASMLEHILELSPGDNVGARYLLIAAYLHTNKLNDAERIIKKYGKEDNAAAFAYARMVLEYKKNGLTSQLKMLYRVAKGINKHVPDYLLGVKRLPNNLPDFVGMGDSNEAIEYVIMHSRLWAGMPELLKWMLKQ
ncbi:tetratricopeptide repeat protein [Paenibacillus sp. NFR01]|uniref:tetratricopeptide repeat protein n=1 Tax=Paenibacillus sp. NFR01 TaxID=1566279 RepID=UPI0008B63896|nr:tetratricopeptide repeat protein [Paenibacillus sp. NFR01]SEU27328.1 Tetratricopeptide repeat-containing protein [Paenibacillus sp. NFR01]